MEGVVERTLSCRNRKFPKLFFHAISPNIQLKVAHNTLDLAILASITASLIMQMKNV